jgi:membrane protein implicated in regulation of membrane protease activity
MVTHHTDGENAARSQSADPTCHTRFGASGAQERVAPESHDEPNPLQPLLAHLAEMREYVSYYLATSADSVKLSIRNTVLYAVLGLLALVVGAAMLITAAVLVLSGIADGLTRLLDGHAWAGQLITGLVVLTLAALLSWFGIKRLMNSSRQKTIDKYEHRLQQQRTAFGHDVHQQARAPGTSAT